MSRIIALLAVITLLPPGCGDDPPEPEDAAMIEVPADTSEPATGPPNLAQRLEPGQARAGKVEQTDALIGGLKADGRVGDYKLYNAHVAFIVEDARPASGYRYRGGSVVDADIVRPAGQPGQDHFGEVIRTWNLEILYPDEVLLVSDGTDGGPAHVRVTGHTGIFWWAANNSFLSTVTYPPTGLEITIDYTLGPDDRALRARHTLKNPADAEVALDFNVTISNHGDGVFPWSPGGGFGDAPSGELPYVGVSGRTLAYGMISPEEAYTSLIDYSAISILLREPAVVPANGERVTDTWVAVTEGGPAGLDQLRRSLTADATPTGTIDGQVEAPAEAGAGWVGVWDGDKPVTLAPIGADGAFSVVVPQGTYTVAAYAPEHPPSAAASVTVAEGETAKVSLEIPDVGRLEVTITDESGAPLDARVTVTTQGEVAPSIPAAIQPGGAVPWPTGVVAVARGIGGEATLKLPVGAAYTVTASHGFTHELAQQTIGPLAAGQTETLTMAVTRAVDTTGWISADFHLHGFRSWDAHVPYAERVREAACEGLHIPIMTEHTYVGSLKPAAAAAGLLDRMAPITGQEVTSLLFGHFNVFPMVEDPTAINGGGIFPLDKDPLALFGLMRTQPPGDAIVQINHPRGPAIGGYFEYVGLEPDLTTARPEDWTTDWDAVEVFNGRCRGPGNDQALADWSALYNHGVRRALSSGSDSHDRTRIPGYPRNWLPLDLATVQADDGALVQAVKERRMMVSCGPFVRLETSDGVGIGGRAQPQGGTVDLHVTVVAPTWIGVDEIRVLENGVVIDVLEPSPTGDPAVRLDTMISVSPTADAWYAVQAVGSGSMAPVVWEGEPFAMTNPIEVDADGDGDWTPPAP